MNAKSISFAGHELRIKDTNGKHAGPGPNYFSAGEENVRVADRGLILSTTYAHGMWHCAEASITTPLGHGEYRFTVARDVTTLEKNHVFAAFLYEDDTQELDIEFSGKMVGKGRGQYVMQPGSTKGNLSLFKMSADQHTTHSISWTPTHVEFKSWNGTGEYEESCSISTWIYAEPGIRSSERAKFILNLWLFKGKPPRHSEEVLITDFQFTPFRS